ncbi:unnamed protein product [Blepharisma stoltei]|uniref:Uncharacterized protein n=1 Tax=Blepharisma stoltei TaxID=1481888 RepID=A0AAU9IZF6_9CILI|nr:unnamed protein product [Blepharisma stoltei]
MELHKHPRNSLSIGETVTLEKITMRYPFVATPTTTTRSHSYLKIYTTAHKSRENSANRLKTRTQKCVTRRNSLVDLIQGNIEEKKPDKVKIIEENKFNAARRNLLQARSDFLELKRDLSTYEYNMTEQISVTTKLARLNKKSSNFPKITYKLQDFYKDCDIHVKKFQIDLEKIKKLPISFDAKNDRNYIKEKLEVRDYINFRKMHLKYQSCACISGIHCIVQVLCNSLYSSVTAVALLPSGQILSTFVDNKVVVSTYGDLKAAFKSKIIPKLYFTITKNDMNLHWDPNYGVTFYTLILKIKGESLPYSMIKLSDFEKKEITICHGISAIEIPFSNLKVKSLERTNYLKLKSILSKHLMYDEENEVIQWNSKQFSIFENKEKDSMYMNIDYIYEVLGIRMFQFHSSYFMDDRSIKIEIWTYKEHYLVKIYKNLELELEVESGSDDYKFLHSLQQMDFVRNPITFSKSLELTTFLKKIDSK